MYVDPATRRARTWPARPSSGVRRFGRFAGCVLISILAVTLVITVLAAWALASMGAAAAFMTFLTG